MKKEGSPPHPKPWVSHFIIGQEPTLVYSMMLDEWLIYPGPTKFRHVVETIYCSIAYLTEQLTNEQFEERYGNFKHFVNHDKLFSGAMAVRLK